MRTKPIHYKGFEISESYNPYNSPFEYTFTNNSGETAHLARSIEEAKEMIDDFYN